MTTSTTPTSAPDIRDTSHCLKEVELFDHDLDPNNPFCLDPEHCRLACALYIFVRPRIYQKYGDRRVLGNGDIVQDALGRCILSQLGLRGELPSVFTDMPSLLRLHFQQKGRKEYLDLLMGVLLSKAYWEPVAVNVWNRWCIVFQLRIPPLGR